MNSLGTSSKWPSYDSLPSTSSSLLSESEQTEDEADVFSEGEGDSGVKRPPSADDRFPLSGNYLQIPPHPDKLHSRCSDQTVVKHPDAACSPGAASLTTSSSLSSPGDLAFAQKCADLHRFIHPLLEVLRGLKTGRFEKGLTSFQQSVAIDRLQRILGILQKPEMGEKYLQNLLQIEMLLKMWLPQEAFKFTDTSKQTTPPSFNLHWHQSQLHIPVKKRKLSWCDVDVDDRVPAKRGHHQHENQGCCHTAASLDAVSTCLCHTAPEGEMVKSSVGDCASRLKFTDRTGLFRGSSKSCGGGESENPKPPEIPPPSSCCSPTTQDCSVSSSNSPAAADSP